MTAPSTDIRTGRERFAQFLAGQSGERLFRWATCHPSQPTGFCPCDGSLPAVVWFYFRAWLLLTALKLAWNRPKLALLRWCGASVGRNVFISTDVWIDPAFPQLLAIEDNVMVGVGVKISTNSARRNSAPAGSGFAGEPSLAGSPSSGPGSRSAKTPSWPAARRSGAMFPPANWRSATPRG